jgi:hypothetical protein
LLTYVLLNQTLQETTQDIEPRTLLTFGASLPVLALTVNTGFAQKTLPFYTEDGIAIDGTDPVAFSPMVTLQSRTTGWVRHGALPPLQTKMRS